MECSHASRKCTSQGVEKIQVLEPFVVVAVGAEQLPRPVVVRAGEGGPFRRVGRFAHERERGDGQAGGGNEVVVLREAVLPLRLRRERVVHEAGVAFERLPDAHALVGGPLVVQEIVRPADRVEQVPRREVGVRLVEGIPPGFVVDRRERPRLRGAQVLRVLLHRVGQAHARDGEPHHVLGPALLRAWRRRRLLADGDERRDGARPLLPVRRLRADAERLDFRRRDEHPGVHPREFGLECHRLRQQLLERGNGLLRGRGAAGKASNERRRHAPPDASRGQPVRDRFSTCACAPRVRRG